MSLDSFNTKSTFVIDDQEYIYYSLEKAADNGLGDITRLPLTLKIVLENLLRKEDGVSVTRHDIEAVADWPNRQQSETEIAFYPARIVMQDFTGVPAIVDLAAMRDAMKKLGGDPDKINPRIPVDLVIDHSITVDAFGTNTAFRKNVELEYQRNRERYRFLKWGQNAFKNFRVVPPGTGIIHQVNLEHLGEVVRSENIPGNQQLAYCDTCVGTDSHTTMINALSVLGWGVGGIEAEAAMLGQPLTMLIPEVVGYRLTGTLKEGTTATDLVLAITEHLRKLNVVGKFVEFYGPGLSSLTLADRATIANMAPEYGATCGFFSVDHETINYLKFTGRTTHQTRLVETYYKKQGMWHNDNIEPSYSTSVGLDLSSIEPSIAGPRRPQDRILLTDAARIFREHLQSMFNIKGPELKMTAAVKGKPFTLKHGDVCIAAITSCTNTSNPAVLIAAGLVAKKANERGLQVKPWVKTSFAPGSQVVSDYLEKAGLQKHLDALGFNLVGYGCTTCIGNSGPLAPEISEAIHTKNIISTSVLSGNRNFEGRVSPDSRANYLASPPLVIAYAIAGNLGIDLYRTPLAQDKNGHDIYLNDLWPTSKEVQQVMENSLNAVMFEKRYADIFKGDNQWKELESTYSKTFEWSEVSTYIQNPPYFENMSMEPAPVKDIINARPLLILGDSVTTDHISPAGAIKQDSPAGYYLQENGVTPEQYNSYGSRRGNHQVMMRGTFANIRIKNLMLPDIEGGYTKYFPEKKTLTIYDAAVQYKKDNIPLIVIGGKEYGTGSSRDWAAKGPLLLGVKAVIADSFERIHRSNLVGMGILPLQFSRNTNSTSLQLDGTETYSITGIDTITPKQMLTVTVIRKNSNEESFQVICRIDTATELEYFKHGGILHKVLRDLA